MKSIQLPFFQKNNHLQEKQGEDEDQTKQNIKILARKCLVSSTCEQNHPKHPFFYQLQYYYKLQNVELPEELTKQIYYIKLLSMKEGYNFSEILQMCCQINNLLFNKQSLLNLRENTSFISEMNLSFTSNNMSEVMTDRNRDILPEININKYIEQIKSNCLSISEIYDEIFKILSCQNKRIPKNQLNINTQKSNKKHDNIQKDDYKLPQFQAKGFLACPKNLKSQIIEFLENNAQKPYPATILTLSYFHGLQDSIQKSEQLGKQFIKNIVPYQYFDLGQSILVGLEHGDALLSQFLFFILNCAEGVNDDQILNDDLPLFFGNGLSSNLLINLFTSFDQDNNLFEKLKQSINKLQNCTQNSGQFTCKNAEQLNQTYQSFSTLFWDQTSQFEKQFSQIIQQTPQNQNNHEIQNSISNQINQNSIQSDQNLENSLYQKNNIYAAFAIEMLIKIGLKMSTSLDQNQIIDLLCLAADKQHLKAFSKLALILYHQYNKLDSTVQSKLISYLDQGCQLLIPACMKVKIQIQILGDNNIRDYKQSYQLMKQLFYLGSDCFRFDMVRLAKFYKDYDFLSLYCDYLQKIGEKNTDLLQGLLYEKGYGRKQNLKQAFTIYSSLIEQQQSKSNKKFDVSLYYRMGKLLKIQNKENESQQYFTQIISQVSNDIRKFDILSQYKIGKMYEKGIGVNKNMRKAEEIYQQILTHDKEKSILNGIFSKILDIKQISNSSPLNNSTIQSISQKNNEYDNYSELNPSAVIKNKLNNNMDSNKQITENFSLQKEKLWESISKNLTVKQRLNKMKSQNQNKYEECEQDIDEFEGYHNGFITHYFSNIQYYKPSNIQLQQQNILYIK